MSDALERLHSRLRVARVRFAALKPRPRRSQIFLSSLWLIGCALSGWAQAPEIARNGVVNAAANVPVELLDGAVAPGTLLAIRGKLFGENPSDISIELHSGTAEVPVEIVSADAFTITARLPASAPQGKASLVVSVRGHGSSSHALNIVSSQVGIYSVNGKGWGPGRIQQLVESGRQPNGVSNAATFGQSLALYGTGLGRPKSVAVIVGGGAAKVLATRFSDGQDEILFQVPANAPEGCFVPVQVRVAGAMVSNTVTVAIHRNGGACLEPQYFPFAGWPDAKFGIVALTRTTQRQYGIDQRSDEAAAWFGKLPGLDRLNTYFLLPPPGTCTSEAEPWRGEFVPATLIGLLASHAGAQALRAGDEMDFDVDRTLRKVSTYRGAQGLFDREFTDPTGRTDPMFPFVGPTVVHVSSKGGADVGPYRFVLAGPEAFQMQGVLGMVQRGQPLPLKWLDMPGDRIPIVFANFVDEASGSRGMCYCVGIPGNTGLTIPASTLAYFPPAGNGPRMALTVAAWPLRPVVFQAAGLDHAVAVNVFMHHSSVGATRSNFRARN
jgi:uncharacterized protein (TIGR03437 family)